MKSTACSRIDVIHEDTIFNANNPSGIIYMVVTAVQFVKGYF